MTAHVPTHPDLGRLAALLGDWQGEGEGQWGSGAPFRYRESVTFGHNGKAFISYMQRTTAVDDGRPLHAEAGFWRALPDGAVEVAMTHPIGVVEIETGRWEGNHLRLRSTTVTCTPTAKTVTGLHRDFEFEGDVLSYSLRMATDGGEPKAHLVAELRRVSAPVAPES